MGQTLAEYCRENGREGLLGEWDAGKNGGRTPDDVSYGSSEMVWWRCARDHSFRMRIAFRAVRGQGCPYCKNRRVLPGYNDLATVEPAIAEQWHPTLNGELTPQTVTAGSSRRVWWQCPEGHVWRTRVDTRTGRQRSGCPVCAGNISPAQKMRYEGILSAVLGEKSKNVGRK